MSTYVITKMFDRLDQICERRYGDLRKHPRIVEYVLEKNPGLEAHSVLLPLGIRVYLPDPPTQTAKKAAPSFTGTIKLI